MNHDTHPEPSFGHEESSVEAEEAMAAVHGSGLSSEDLKEEELGRRAVIAAIRGARRAVSNPGDTHETVISANSTSAMLRINDVSPMPSVSCGRGPVSDELYEDFVRFDRIAPEYYQQYDVKRGLRNADGSGVLVGLTTVCDVHGYTKGPDGVHPDRGRLSYRGYDVEELVRGAQADQRFGYEEVSYLLLTGNLPTVQQLDDFNRRIDSRRRLSLGYLSLFPRRTRSSSIMNVLQRATLLLYAFDDDPDDTSPEHEVDVVLSLLGRLPRIAAVAHTAYAAEQEATELRIPPVCMGYSMAETILDVLRGNQPFTREEALLLDVMLMLHAEHGGGNNSTFTTRVLSSSGTDAYSAYAAAMGSLKGPKHGGANSKAPEMIADIAAHVADPRNEDEVASYLEKIARGEAFDKTGLIYGVGHAVYTLSDPRCKLISSYAENLADERGFMDRYQLIRTIERVAPEVVRTVHPNALPMCANIDLYTGFVYDMLDIPPSLHTPIFAMARLSGWAAHRMEELYGAARIIRPAYRCILTERSYKPLAERDE